jgi:hypothetical protein
MKLHWLSVPVIIVLFLMAVIDGRAESASASGEPSGLVYEAGPRPWGDTYLPKSKPPARRLIVVDARKCEPNERIALWSLQALVSRTRPRFWVSLGKEDQRWLDWHVEMKHIDGYDTVDDWRTLFATYRSAYKGAIAPDPKLYRGDLLAANTAACEDLIIADPKLAAELKLPVKIDLRGRFKTYAAGMEWLWGAYKNQLSRHICGYHHPTLMNTGAFSYLMQWRGVAFWLAGKVDSAEPGADIAAEKKIIAKIMSELAPNTPIMGFPYAGTGIGPGEPQGVAFASKYAKALVCTDHLRNTCVTSGVRIDKWTQPKQTPTPKLDRSKIYIALALSDGDNMNVWRGFSQRYFTHKDHGKIPVAFGMGPAIADIQPAIAQWYYAHAATNTEFFADVSGIAYTKLKVYGAAYTDPPAVMDGYLNWTRIYLDKMNMRTVRTVSGDDAFLKRYVARLPKMHSILADMGCYSGYKGIDNLTYTLDGMAIFRAATTWRGGVKGFLPEIRKHVGKKRPAFVNGFLHCWTFNDLDKIHTIHENRDADMIFVTPTQLAELYRQAEKITSTSK